MEILPPRSAYQDDAGEFHLPILDELTRTRALIAHQAELRACQRCPKMIGPVVCGAPVASPILLVGQAPGDREPKLGRPFAWTAGKQLFKWFASIGVDEARFRERVYMAAVCRCFPGKAPLPKPRKPKPGKKVVAKGANKTGKGAKKPTTAGDRVPSPEEISACGGWLERELALLQPELVIPVGKLAIAQFLEPSPLVEQIGRLTTIERMGRRLDVLPLPHPSGASTWHRMEPGLSLLKQALARLEKHSAWRQIR